MKTITSKILLTIATLATCAATNANAYQDAPRSGFYLGVDMVRSFAKHKYLAEGNGLSDNPVPTNGYYSNREKNGLGINLGYKIAAGNLFIAPEIFYDYLNNSAKDFGYEQDPTISGHRLEVNQRYGAKLNVGYNLFAGLNAFANIGMANVNYSMNLYSVNHTRQGVVQMNMIYGGGLSYDLNDHWLLKTSYDWQQFTARFDYPQEKDRIVLQTVKVGIAYKF